MRYQKTLHLLWITSLLLLGAGNIAAQTQTWNPGHAIATVNGIYAYSYNQTPAQLVELYPAAIPNTGLTYQWYSSTAPTAGFSAISGATLTSYSPAALTTTSVTTYYYRVTTSPTIGVDTSNTVKIAMVSANWEDLNYIREHDVQNTGQTTWYAVDQLPIGSKFQTTNYLDGLGRSIEKVSKQTATPASGSSTWGDIVKFSQYDAMGREPKIFLPYTTSSQVGYYKTTAATDQPAYYSNTATYNETSAFTNITYDNSPLNRVTNVKEPGTSWAASAGNTLAYDMNKVTDSVQIWRVDYTQGDAPVNNGSYSVNTLYETTSTDMNGNQVVEFMNMSGQIVLKKVQAVPSPAGAYAGWICTYYVYDDFGQLSYEIEPEGVKYLSANGWSFTGTNGASVLAEQVFQYSYDDKGRIIRKKTPGSAPLTMIYDVRDRLVFSQDGNQAALSPAQWTARLYDGLDREIMMTLYNTTETIASLQSDLAGSITTSTISTTTPAVTLTTFNNPITTANLNSATVCTILKYAFYDNYSFTTAKAFNTSFTNTTAYSTSDPNVIPIVNSQRTWSMKTGSLIRVLGSTLFLSNTNYYDEKGNHIQSLEDNIKSGTDITTMQYRWDMRVLSTCIIHTNASAGYTSFVTLNKNIFDNLGRVTSIQKTLGSNAAVTVVSYAYDDMGRMLTKTLAPGYANTTTGGSQLESLNYSFNIHNQITGINKDYALKTSGIYSKWGHYFGLYLGYDNKDNAFKSAQLDGQVTGAMWSTQGDDAQRKYDYSYDNASRLINAAFNQQQHPGDGWANSTMDFSVSGTSGQITYDNNGNLLTMLQRGVIPGQAAPITIDDLRYRYNPYSNRLMSVTDTMQSPTFNGLSGDFKDGTNAAGTPDYVYDNNGNIVVDLNKNIQSLNNGAAGTAGIHYNFMDKPDQIRIPGKGTILIAYDADGNKLQRAFVPDAGGAGPVITYINQFIYQETATLTVSSLPPFNGTTPHLAFINFEEGRIRAMTPTSTNNGYDGMSEGGNLVLPAAPSGGYTSGAWDYFIMDYLQNVRMVLTEETHSATNECTMETTNSRPAAEDPVFGQTGSANEVEVTRIATPSAWTGNTSASVSHLGNLSGHTLGPNSLQKVMAGDQISTSVQYYYAASSTSTNPNIIPNLLASLTSVIGNGSASSGTLVHSSATNVTNNLNSVPGFTSAVEPNSNTTGTPQAYLTILFFDERFNFIAAADGGVAQLQVRSSDAGNASAAPLVLTNIQAPRNGYAYIYISNRSDQDVFFDNLTINIKTGNIAEENHYYAYGLKIAAISSHKLGDAGEGYLQNNNQFQGVFSEADADIGWDDFDLREYDPQIGRWVQQDPYDQGPSPYQGMGADPINGVDPSGGILFDFGTIGDITGSVALDRLVVSAGASVVGFAVDKLAGGNGWAGAVVGAGVGFASTFIPPFSIEALLGKSTAVVASATISVARAGEDLTARSEVTAGIQQITMTPPNILVAPPVNAPTPSLPHPAPPPPPPPAPKKPTRPIWVENAEIERARGVEEDPARAITKTNKKGKKYKEGCNCGVDVEKYLASVGLDAGQPWCAAFLNWVLGKSHIKGTKSGAAMSFATWGQELKNPAYGCIGVLEYTDKNGKLDHHVTIIVGVNKYGELIGLGGNQGDKVKYSAYPRSYFKTFRYPPGQTPDYHLPLMDVFNGSERTR